MGVAYDIDERLGVLEIKRAKPTVRARAKQEKATKGERKAPRENVASQVFVLDTGLTPEQEAYARARAFGLDKKDAIKFATNGKTTAVSAATNMEKQYPLVLERINQLNMQVAVQVVEKVAISKAWVMERLKEVAERCMQAEPVMVNGEPTGEYKFDSAGANRSLELLGKELGMFATKIDITKTEVTMLPEDQLRKAALALAAETGLVIDGETGRPVT